MLNVDVILVPCFVNETVKTGQSWPREDDNKQCGHCTTTILLLGFLFIKYVFLFGTNKTNLESTDFDIGPPVVHIDAAVLRLKIQHQKIVSNYI